MIIRVGDTLDCGCRAGYGDVNVFDGTEEIRCVVEADTRAKTVKMDTILTADVPDRRALADLPERYVIKSVPGLRVTCPHGPVK